MSHTIKIASASTATALLLLLHSTPATAAAFLQNGAFLQDDDVALFSFAVGGIASSSVTIQTFNYNSTSVPFPPFNATGGFDPLLSLFNFTTGDLIDEGFDIDGSNFDANISTQLDPGQYLFTITQWDNFITNQPGDNNPPNLFLNDFLHEGEGNFTLGFPFFCSQNFGDSNCNPRNGLWRVGIEGDNVESLTLVPIPAALPLLLTALGVLGLGFRRSNASQLDIAAEAFGEPSRF